MLDDKVEGPSRETAPIVERARAFASNASGSEFIFRKAYRRLNSRELVSVHED